MEDDALETIVDVSPQNSEIARNYTYILIGILFFPLLIVAHLAAKRKNGIELDGFGHSHYRLQYRTTSFALGTTVTLLVVSGFIMFFLRDASPPQHAGGLIWLVIPLNLGKPVFLWVVVRCVRGLYLAGACRKVQKPETYWIWP